MFPELIAAHLQLVSATRAMLKDQGCQVVDFRQTPTRPVLEVRFPPVELLDAAVRIVERDGSGSRSVWVTSLNGCRIIWR